MTFTTSGRADQPPRSSSSNGTSPNPWLRFVIEHGISLGVPITFFKNPFAETKKEKDLTLEELRDLILTTVADRKDELPWLKLAKFGNKRTIPKEGSKSKGSLRHDDNVVSITGVELDYDGEKISFQQGIEMVEAMGIEALIYTSPRHTDAAPRWRIIATTSGPLPPPEREKLVARMNGFMGCILEKHIESFTLSQSYYYGRSLENKDAHHQAVVIDGDFIDLREDLKQYQDAGMPDRASTSNGQASGDSGAAAAGARSSNFDFDDETDRFRAIMATLGDGPPGSGFAGFNNVLIAATSSYAATHAEGFNREELKTILRSAINDAPRQASRKQSEIDRYLSDRYLDQIIMSGIKKWGEEAQARRDEAREEQVRASYAATGKGPDRKNSKDKKLPLHIKLAELCLDVMTNNGRDLQVVPDEEGANRYWKYEDGLWTLLWDKEVKEWLEPELQRLLIDLDKKGKSKNTLFREAVSHMLRSQKIRELGFVKWNAHGKVPTKSGLIDPRTLEVEPIRKDHYCTWRIDIEYDPTATCPLWEQMLGDAFTDREGEDSRITLDLMQELTGATLSDDKPKAMRKALILLGKPDSGKTGLLDVMSGLHTDKPITTTLEELEGNHGLQGFHRRAPWVLHEAFNATGWRVSDRAKLIISGDPIPINPKNKDAITVRPRTPPLWATNYEPKFKDPSGALAERLEMIACNVAFDKEKPTGVAALAKAAGLGDPASLVLRDEKAGVFNWALKGLRRALERGYFIRTEAGKEMLEELKVNANICRGFINDCIEYDPDKMMSTADFQSALSAWWYENHGDEHSRNPCNPTKIGQDLKALGNPRIGLNKKRFKDRTGKRFILGIKLNEAGRDFWESANITNFNDDRPKPGSRISATVKETEQPIAEDWLTSPEVIRLKKEAGQ